MPPKKKQSASSSTGDWSSGDGLLPGRDTVGPLFLMIVPPVFSMVYYHVVANLHGDFLQFLNDWKDGGFFSTLYEIWPSPWDPEALKLVASFLTFQAVIMRIVPGKTFRATTTPEGNVPVYKANGMACYIITLVTLLLLSYTKTVRLALVYDKFGNILSTMNVLALTLCAILVVKGYVAPSTTDSGPNKNAILDFYWGMELYPRILGWDIKQFTNCRAGLMFWAVGILCFADKNMEVNGGELQWGMAVNVVLQLVYIFKFFHWEMGYMCSMDIQVDRAGFYLCWGCLVWVPSVYTSSSFYLAENGPPLSPAVACVIFLMGLLMIFINYDSDNQRYVFRQTNGNCKIWGKTPEKLVVTYKSGDEEKTSLLLLDGYWKISRHFHYIPEILASLFWSLPALNSGYFGPYFYVAYLTLLLTDRAYRDDDRCRKKYGENWDKYCAEVPYKIVPGVL